MDGVPGADVVGKYRLWGFRRARRDAAVDRDLQLPAAVESLLLLVDVNAKKGVVRMESVAPEQTPPLLSADLPPFTRTGPKVWEAVVPLTGDEKSLDRTFVVVGLLGFAVFL
jgi:hypothetical protein